ncbi:lactase/phlorizin hydrolase-like [Branchiostoma floridae x Branchiostoma japonicum]
MSGTMLPLLTTSLLLGFTCGAVYDYGAYDRTRDNFRPGTFPDDFIWSTATASYQIEGAWNVDGKGESIWDRFSHTPGKVDRGDTGDVACDSYNKYREDVQLMKAMGLKYYRFSLSWPRIFPDGTVAGGVNQAGVDYYNNVIDELLANGITPMVTLYHWDLPQALQDRYGGWVNEALVDHFNDYADFVFQTFGDRVRYWITFNEPWVVCFLGYGTGGNAPGIQDSGNSTYLCGHTILKAHAEAWNTYDTTYRGSQQGQISITLNCDWPEPRDPDSPADVAAADRYIQFYIGWFAHPIYSAAGDYPAAMKDIIREKSLAEGLQESRLPQFTPAEIDRIKGTGDFFGLNHYTARIIQNRVDPTDTPGYSNDRNLSESTAPEWPRAASEWLYVVPWGLRRLLKFIKLNYRDPDVYITENGRSDHDEQPPVMEDADRICYYMGYIDEVLKAIEVDGVKVRAYTAWSLMDNFEWSRGYTERFGLHYVNFTDPDRPRVPKESAGFYRDVIANNGFPEGADVTKMVRSRWEGFLVKMSGTMLGLFATSLLLGLVWGAEYNYGAYDHSRDAFRPGRFPDGFIWSTATASYQIEGGWEADGKGESIWDRFSHTPGKVDRGDTGDVACDSYNKYREDVQLMADLGLKYYRFSLSWTRIFPDGTLASGPNEAGVAYYNNLIDELVRNGVTPMVTLYHWDLPQNLQDTYGGWVSQGIVKHFNDYATFAFQTFGDRVQYWITFNEPWVVCYIGYGTGEHAPGIQDERNSTYLCGHNILKAHANAWHTYDTGFRQSQGGQVGITLNSDWAEPRDPDLVADVIATDRYLQFYLGWFANPIYSVGGDYPVVMKEAVLAKSQAEGLRESRLPQFTQEEVEYIRGTSDFFGLNHYTTRIIEDNVVVGAAPGYANDRDIAQYTAPEWSRAESEWLYEVPWGLRRLLNFIKLNYGDPEVLVTENGRSDGDVTPPLMVDTCRICYYMTYIDEVLKAIEEDGVKVRAYTAWSLMDNFEWARGYTERFGLHYVDFNDLNRPRTPKESAGFFKDVIANNGFPEGADVTRMVQDMWRDCRGAGAKTHADIAILALAFIITAMYNLVYM